MMKTSCCTADARPSHALVVMLAAQLDSRALAAALYTRPLTVAMDVTARIPVLLLLLVPVPSATVITC
jgi:hypothetical protein